MQPFVVEVSPAAAGVIVDFAPAHGRVSELLVFTGTDGRAQSTLTLGRRIGTTTITVSAPGDSVTFTATAIARTPPKPPPMNRLNNLGQESDRLGW